MTHKIFSVQQKIRFQHTDPAGIVFFPRFLEMMNATNEDFWEHMGFSLSEIHMYGMTPIVNVNIDFKKPVYLGSTITKYMEMIHIGRSSHTMRHWFECEGELILEGTQTSVFVAKQEDGAFKSDPLPDIIRQAMQEYLKA